MRGLGLVVLQLALGLWVGALVVVSFVVAPAVFDAVPSETAGTVMGAIFPRYYAFTAGAGVVALAAAALVRPSSWRALAVVLAVMLVATAYAGGVVSPRARALRPALRQTPVDAAVRAEFESLHRRAVQLNGLVLVLGLAAVALATRGIASRARG
jgi:hypothetical protein